MSVFLSVVALAGGMFKIGCGTLAVVRLLSCAEEQQAYDNKMCAASFPMPFPASTLASFAIYRSMSLIARLKMVIC